MVCDNERALVGRQGGKRRLVVLVKVFVGAVLVMLPAGALPASAETDAAVLIHNRAFPILAFTGKRPVRVSDALSLTVWPDAA